MTLTAEAWAEHEHDRARRERQDTPEYCRMGARLGYTYLTREDRSKVVPLSTFVLPPCPFLIVGPLCIVTELVLDEDGHEITARNGHARTRHILRWVGFRPFK